MVELAPQSGVHWTAAHIRPRCEKIVAKYCELHAIPCYLPLRRRAKRYQRRTVATFLPMFPGYVFVQLDEERQSLLRRSNRVVTVLQVNPTAEARLLMELREVQRLEQAALEDELLVLPELSTGKTVLITSGPLRGIRGIVERRASKTRVIVNVDILGQAAAVDLDVEEVTTDQDG